MSHTFEIQLAGDAGTALGKVKDLFNSTSGGTFEGDHEQGRFSGSGVRGVYHVKGSVVTITITDKPFLAPNKIIESKIRGFFRESI